MKRDAGRTPASTSLACRSDAAGLEPEARTTEDTACILKGEGTLSKQDSTHSRRIISNRRVPVLAPNGQPLMPTKARRARIWIRSGKAKQLRNNLGMFMVQLIGEPSGRKTQTMALGIDPGSKFTGVAVCSKDAVHVGFNLELPCKVHEKIQKRSELRRTRRQRKSRRREARFNNRTGSYIAPSIIARKQFELRIARDMARVLPISVYVLEDVCFEHTNHRWGKNFSQIEVGKNWLIHELNRDVNVQLFQGYETSIRRKELGLSKSSNKDARNPSAHVSDAISLCSLAGITSMIKVPIHFDILQRPKYDRRKLHAEQPSKGGIRRKQGGTVTPFSVRKGDLVMVQQRNGAQHRGWVSGNTINRVSVSAFDWKRIGQFPSKQIQLINRNSHVVAALLPQMNTHNIGCRLR